MDPSFPNKAIDDAVYDKEDNILMPAKNVARIMRRALPPNAKISEEAKQMVMEAVTEYVRFITGEASEQVKEENRKILTADDLLQAMSRLGLDNYADVLGAYHTRLRESEASRSGGSGSADGPGTSSAVPGQRE